MAHNWPVPKLSLIVDRKDIREFYRFLNSDRQSIEKDIESIKKEKNDRKK